MILNHLNCNLSKLDHLESISTPFIAFFSVKSFYHQKMHRKLKIVRDFCHYSEPYELEFECQHPKNVTNIIFLSRRLTCSWIFLYCILETANWSWKVNVGNSMIFSGIKFERRRGRCYVCNEKTVFRKYFAYWWMHMHVTDQSTIQLELWNFLKTFEDFWRLLRTGEELWRYLTVYEDLLKFYNDLKFILTTKF